MRPITRRLTMACTATVLTLGLVACGGSSTTSSATDSTTSAADSTTSAAGSATSAADSAASGAPGSASSAGTKVSANTASEDEIAAALKSAGVSDPERWAEEVVEYRPYPTDDPDLTKLRENLQKYNPGQETIDQIVSTLTP